MKKIILAATALSLMAAPAFAQATAGSPQTATVEISGWVNANCTGVTGGPFELGNIGGATPGSLSTSSFNSPASVTVICNGAGTQVTVEANPLTRQGTLANPVPSGYTTPVNYTATLDRVTGVTQATTAPTDTSAVSGPGTSVLAGLTNGTFRLIASSLTAGTDLVVAGNYAGTTSVVVSPGL